MKLIKIEAHGFKSFANPIVLNFDGGVVGIVGPNGSGKSNINDAIKWVLGEQSSKELRGDNMEDVIFSGSKTAKALDKAQVTLTFDNSAGLSSVDSKIVTISRVLERGKGINEYYLNGQKCRHKDIKTIAMETGIGKSSLAIISQGTVSEIAQSSDENRRLIFEEAAGVSKYKFRKQEALKKLERTDAALSQINTVIKELEKRLLPLKAQAEKAILYRDKSKQLKEVEIAFLANQINALDKEYKQLEQELAGVGETKESYKNNITDLSMKLVAKKANLTEVKALISQIRAKKEAINARLNDLNVIYAKETQRRDMIAKGELQTSSKELQQSIISKIKDLEQKVVYFNQAYDEIQQKFIESTSKIRDINIQINNYNITKQEAERKMIEIQTKINIFNEKKQSQSNLFKGTRTIVQNKSLFPGYKGLVSDLLTVPEQYVTAIETILANATQHVVVNNSNTAVNCVNFLKKNNGGRATFIPLESIKGKFIRDDYLLVLKNQKGFIGIAKDLVTVDKKYNVLNDFLLGNIIVVDTVDNANNISKIVDKKYMVVSLDGDVIRVGGIIVGGTSESTNELIGLEYKIEQLKELIPGLESIIYNAELKSSELKNELSKLQSYNQEYTTQKTSVSFHLSTTNKELDEWKAKIIDFNEEDDQESASIPTFETIGQLSKEVRLLDLDLQAQITIKNGYEAEISNLEIELNKSNSMLIQLTESFEAKISKFNKIEFNLDQYRERLTNFYELTLENALENYQLNMSIDAAKELIAELKAEIAKLGNVNLESIVELEEVENRYADFSSNYEELTEAKNTILNAISEIDKIIINRLTNVIHDVNLEFDRVFHSMFGGGSAKIKFIDPSDPLESGITIYAQPPGKSIKNLKLFSGGEKSLIAISLLFAILKARPLPLCILDEVEAALDESNVVRYAKYLQQLKDQTQFIVITHRTGTMSRVDSLFGATMQHRGITSFFSVKLADAKNLIEPQTNHN
ncbi:AAA family ATPase [Mycoplasma sp. NEAQ87857]|uniref:AAA family ATPase n=1 Tax=Mycoplasma sp. NEAQ87857 TaxID=2683967 RepID=UPI00131983EA|nr:AAA family ATPase [Mycoplasma sp. NEAQ87857]QGZ97782.1 AAA family ATPase [Mycoplasma sp. NEAQ87857]